MSKFLLKMSEMKFLAMNRRGWCCWYMTVCSVQFATIQFSDGRRTRFVSSSVSVPCRSEYLPQAGAVYIVGLLAAGSCSGSGDLWTSKQHTWEKNLFKNHHVKIASRIVSYGWWRGTVVERWSLAGELSLSCARPAADGWPLMWVSHPLQVSQLGQLSLSSFRGR